MPITSIQKLKLLIGLVGELEVELEVEVEVEKEDDEFLSFAFCNKEDKESPCSSSIRLSSAFTAEHIIATVTSLGLGPWSIILSGLPVLLTDRDLPVLGELMQLLQTLLSALLLFVFCPVVITLEVAVLFSLTFMAEKIDLGLLGASILVLCRTFDFVCEWGDIDGI